MITVVSLVLWATVAAAFWWLAQRQSQLLDYAEKLLRDAAKDRHPAGSRTVAPEPEEPADVADWQPNPDPATDPVGMPPIRRPQPGPATVPAAAVIADEWEQKRDAMVADMLAEIRGTS